MSEDSISMVNRIKNRSTRAAVPERATSFIEITGDPTAVPSSLPKASPEPEVLPKTASRRQIRLMLDLDSEIEVFCKQHKITIETYLESLHLACKHDIALREGVLTEARKRLSERKKAGKIRRLQTQMKQEL